MKNEFAFPSTLLRYIDGTELQSIGNQGMTLLDYFAGQALTGYIAKHDGSYSLLGKELAECSYRVASHMLIEREKYVSKEGNNETN